MLMILGRNERENGRHGELRNTVERVVREVVPRLLGDEHLGGKKGIVPVVVHGDLWSGNTRRGRFTGREGIEGEVEEEVIFDPSAFYAHNEYDFGIMQMFSGVSKKFYDEYFEIVPKTEPVEEFEDRVALYEVSLTLPCASFEALLVGGRDG
jgi:fructosamine-3-kinase